ncbi:hypothetical protein CEXT_121301 [Caerostris extrusa]|uniref:Uncharacterized protein n=1 Tax=Caerostris extrusa TaxID=172846 RepID=A0AAV4TXV6_CAEEX|nr:hypothetical protein CEXT_121301 [Caerostris extrusa]
MFEITFSRVLTAEWKFVECRKGLLYWSSGDVCWQCGITLKFESICCAQYINSCKNRGDSRDSEIGHMCNLYTTHKCGALTVTYLLVDKDRFLPLILGRRDVGDIQRRIRDMQFH